MRLVPCGDRHAIRRCKRLTPHPWQPRTQAHANDLHAPQITRRRSEISRGWATAKCCRCVWGGGATRMWHRGANVASGLGSCWGACQRVRRRPAAVPAVPRWALAATCTVRPPPHSQSLPSLKLVEVEQVRARPHRRRGVGAQRLGRNGACATHVEARGRARAPLFTCATRAQTRARVHGVRRWAPCASCGASSARSRRCCA